MGRAVDGRNAMDKVESGQVRSGGLETRLSIYSDREQVILKFIRYRIVPCQVSLVIYEFISNVLLLLLVGGGGGRSKMNIKTRMT